jgi:hypothetical protein
VVSAVEDERDGRGLDTAREANETSKVWLFILLRWSHPTALKGIRIRSTKDSNLRHAQLSGAWVYDRVTVIWVGRAHVRTALLLGLWRHACPSLWLHNLK